MRITLLGTGEAFDHEAGNNACLMHGSSLPTVLFDCGYQIPERLWRERRLYPSLAAVCLTHLHADHVFGIVPVLMRFWEEARREPLMIIGPRGTERFIRRLFEMGYPGIIQRLGFDLEFREASEETTLKLGPLQLRFARSEHSVLNLAVRVDHRGSSGGGSLGISGDGQLTDGMRALFGDVDLLLQETYFLKPGNPVHCDLETLREFVSGSKIGRVGVTHTSRFFRKRIAAQLEKLNQAAKARKDPRWFLAQPGKTLRVR